MNNTFKRVLSLMLAASMCFSSVPGYASEGGTEAATEAYTAEVTVDEMEASVVVETEAQTTAATEAAVAESETAAAQTETEAAATEDVDAATEAAAETGAETAASGAVVETEAETTVETELQTIAAESETSAAETETTAAEADTIAEAETIAAGAETEVIAAESEADITESDAEAAAAASVTLSETERSDIDEDAKAVRIQADGASDKDTEVRLYFWDYADELPSDDTLWTSLLTVPFEYAEIDGINKDGTEEDSQTIELPVTASGANSTDARYKEEYDDYGELESVCLEFTLPAGSSMDAQIVLSLGDGYSTADVVIEAVSISDDMEGILCGLNLEWAGEETDSIETEAETDSTDSSAATAALMSIAEVEEESYGWVEFVTGEGGSLSISFEYDGETYDEGTYTYDIMEYGPWEAQYETTGTITATASADSGYAVDAITVTDESGEVIASCNGNGESSADISFSPVADSELTVTASFCAVSDDAEEDEDSGSTGSVDDGIMLASNLSYRLVDSVPYTYNGAFTGRLSDDEISGYGTYWNTSGRTTTCLDSTGATVTVYFLPSSYTASAYIKFDEAFVYIDSSGTKHTCDVKVYFWQPYSGVGGDKGVVYINGNGNFMLSSYDRLLGASGEDVPDKDEIEAYIAARFYFYESGTNYGTAVDVSGTATFTDLDEGEGYYAVQGGAYFYNLKEYDAQTTSDTNLAWGSSLSDMVPTYSASNFLCGTTDNDDEVNVSLAFTSTSDTPLTLYYVARKHGSGIGGSAYYYAYTAKTYDSSGNSISMPDEILALLENTGIYEDGSSAHNYVGRYVNTTGGTAASVLYPDLTAKAAASGYIFNGWYTTSSYSGTQYAGETAMTASMRLYASFTKDTGDLAVTKVLDMGDYDASDLGDDTDTYGKYTKFTFSVYEADADDDDEPVASGTLTLSDILSGNNTVTILNLPTGAYIVVETMSSNAGGCWMTVGSTSRTVTINTGETATAEFENRLRTGSINVTKILDAGNYDASEVGSYCYIRFDLTGTSKTGIEVSRSLSVNASDFANGQAAVTFEGIPVGTDYTVTETMGNVCGIYWTASGDASVSGLSVTNGGVTETSFTNTLNTGSVKVTKNISLSGYSVESLKSATFLFTLSGTSATGITINKTVTVGSEDFSDGKAAAAFDNVPYGTYTVTEYISDDCAAAWECTSSLSKTVTLDSDSAEVSFTNKLLTGELTVIKTLDAGNYDLSTLSGVEFIFTLTGTSYAGISVNESVSVSAPDFSNGTAMATFTGIPAGSYLLTESVEGEGASWSVSVSAVQEVTVVSGVTNTAYFTNVLNTGSVTVTKKIDTGYYNPDDLYDYSYFIFTLSGTSDSGIVVSQTKHVSASDFAEGIASVTFTDIPAGTYTVTESMGAISEGLWTNVGDESKEVTVTRGITSELDFTNRLNTYTVTVNKTVVDESGTVADASGFIFTLEGISMSGIVILKTAETNENGVAEFTEVPAGIYTVTETSTSDSDSIPSWWSVSGKSQEITVTGDMSVSVTNTYKTGSVKVTKETVGSNAGSNTFTFTLSGESEAGSWVELTGTITGAGSYVFEGVPIGTYTIKETFDNDYWTCEDDEQEVTVYSNAEVSVSFTNTLITRTRIVFSDYDTDYELDGISYSVYDSEGELVGTYTSSSGSNIVITGLTAGETCTVVENVPKEYYSREIYDKDGDGIPVDNVYQNTAKFTVTDTDEVQVVNLYNKVVTGSITITKTGDSAVAYIQDGVLVTISYVTGGLPDTKYSVTAKEDIVYPDGSGTVLFEAGEKVAALTTDENGEASVSDLYIGKYTVTETEAPNGYVLNAADASHDADLAEAYQKAYDAGGYLTASVSISLEYENALRRLDVGSDEDPYGDPSEDPYGGLYGRTGIYKYNGDGNPVADAEFTLYAGKDILDVDGNIVIPEGTAVAVAVSDEDGRAAFDVELPIGYYYAKETKAPSGYLAVTDIIEFDAESLVYDDAVAIVRMTASVTDILTKTTVSVRDLDTEVELDGVAFVITDSDGNEIARIASENGSNVEIQGLTVGKTYTVTIETPRDGYTDTAYDKDGYEPEDGEDVALDSVRNNTVMFTVSETEEIQVVTVFLKPVLADLLITKTGEVPEVSVYDNELKGITYSVKGLPGTEYTVTAAEDIENPDGYSENIYNKGDTVASVETDENGETLIEGLYLGKYTVTEDSAPEGYVREADDCSQTVDLYEAYLEQCYDAGDYSTALVEVGVSFYNERQVLDIGTDPDVSDDPLADPYSALYGISGITKISVDGMTEEPVEGAEFSLYAYEDITDIYGNVIIPKDTLVAVAVSDENGRVAFDVDLPLGIYYAVETQSPVGYQTNDEIIILDGTKCLDDERVEILRVAATVDNYITRVVVNLMDYDTEVELDGAMFQILDEEGDVVAEFASANGANTVIRGLGLDTVYTIVETIPRSGYTTAFYAKDGYTSEYAESGYMVNKRYYDAVDLETQTVKNNTATFVIEDTGDVQVISLFAKPVTADLTVTKSGEAARTSVKNGILKSITYSVKGLPGAEYDIIAAEDIEHPDGYSDDIYTKGTVVSSVTTDDDGYAVAEGLPLGVYTVKETAAPSGYMRDSDDCTQQIDLWAAYEADLYDEEDYTTDTQESTVSFYNERQIVDLGSDPDLLDDNVAYRDPESDLYLQTGIYKIGVDGRTEAYVAGATFGLYAEEDILDVYGNVIIPAGTLVDKAVSDVDGRAAFTTDLPVGKYYAKEESAPAGYTLSDEIIYFDTVSYAEDESVQIIRMQGIITNTVTSMKVFLVDTYTKNELAGAVLQIVDDYGTVYGTFSTEDTEGAGHVIKGLTPGTTYHIVEFSPREGYVTRIIIPDDMADILTQESKTDVSFVAEDGLEITIENTFVTGSFAVDKEAEQLNCVRITDEDKYYLGTYVQWRTTRFTYLQMNQSGAEFSVYAAEDIYYPDGIQGILYYEGDLADMDVKSFAPQTGINPAVVTTGSNGRSEF
ncbi:MAG: DUF5979 domain-containing protein [Lachnospiraceae bacterium]|nr:DUF5979 domain-containing protein [Lachnospiraceae bacterium]